MIRILFVALTLLVAGCSSEQAGRNNPVGAVKASTGAQVAGASSIMSPRTRGGTFANVPDRGQLLAYPSASAGGTQAASAERNVVRDGAYTWHRADLSEAHAVRAIVDGKLTVNTPSGEQLQFKYDRHVEHASGDWTWVGHLEGGLPSDQIVLTFGERAAFGNIAQPGKDPLRLTVRNGRSWLVETDRVALGKMNTPLTKPRRPDYLVPPKTAQKPSRGGPTKAALKAESSVPSSNIVDLVVGYTDGYAAGLGGSSQAVTRLNNLVMITNQAYANSQVVAEVRLVGTVQVAYPDATENEIALEELSGYRDGTSIPVPAALQALRNARETYGGDLVSLVRKFQEPENDSCGIAWLLGGDLSGITQEDGNFGYSVVSDGSDGGFFCRDETFAHEVGHNMGSQHDRATATSNNTVSFGAYPYSFGYKTDAALGNFYTIMAYGESGQARYRVFSNPRITFCGGFNCGVENEADNARSLTQTIPVVSTFRATVVPLPSPEAKDDVNNDGKSDIVWYHAPTRTLAYWIMNGSAVTSSGGQVLSGDYAALTTGDFNGDGYVDVLARGPTGDLRVFVGNGSSFTGTTAGTYPSGWEVVGSGDVNNDGKSDIVWYHAPSRTLAYWIMNGATVTSSGGQVLSGDYAAISVGDYNGDSLADVLSRGPAGDLRIFVGNGSSFTGATVGTYPSGWEVVGSEDVDNDNKSDIVWYHAPTRTLAYWVMNGTTVTRSGGQVLSGDYDAITVGDYNGDGLGDVLSRGPSGDLRIWIGNGSSFTGATVADYPSGWEVVGSGEEEIRNDIDNDGKSDIVWFHAPSQSLAYWVMNSATVTRSGGQVLTGGYEALAAGDVNGDGLADIVSKGPSGDLRIWIGNGSVFSGVTAGTYPAGWTLVGTGDIDNDGKADLVFYHAPSATLGYWVMNGATVTRTGGQVLTGNYEALSVGDYNGDGIADVASKGPGGDLRMWIGNGSTFTGTNVGTYPAGWTVLSSADIDNDGKSDLVFFHAPSETLGYWVMNTATVTRSGGQVLTGYEALATGDYNGDGIADVLSKGTGGDLRIWIGNGSVFTASTVGTYPAGWSVIK